MSNVLVIGGTRSGKSAVAESLASQWSDRLDLAVTYLATASPDDGDDDHAARIEVHRARRPSTWQTIECAEPGQLPAALTRASGVVLLDSIGTWAAGHPEVEVDGAAIDAMVSAVAARTDPTVVVAEDVGSSLHADTAIGRRFVDAVGRTTVALAREADETWFVAAGRVQVLRSAEIEIVQFLSQRWPIG